MIYNGKIRIVTNSESVDENGYPAITKVGYSDNIDCQISGTRDNSSVYENGNYTDHQYEILIPYNPLLKGKRIEVTDVTGVLGEFTVKDIQHLNLVGRTKIWLQ